MRTASVQRGPEGDNGGCLTICMIVLIIILCKMCTGN